MCVCVRSPFHLLTQLLSILGCGLHYRSCLVQYPLRSSARGRRALLSIQLTMIIIKKNYFLKDIYINVTSLLKKIIIVVLNVHG